MVGARIPRASKLGELMFNSLLLILLLTVILPAQAQLLESEACIDQVADAICLVDPNEGASHNALETAEYLATREYASIGYIL